MQALCAEAEDWVGMEYERRLRAEIDYWNEIRVLRAEDRRAGESLRWTAETARMRGEGGLVSHARVRELWTELEGIEGDVRGEEEEEEEGEGEEGEEEEMETPAEGEVQEVGEEEGGEMPEVARGWREEE